MSSTQHVPNYSKDPPAKANSDRRPKHPASGTISTREMERTKKRALIKHRCLLTIDDGGHALKAVKSSPPAFESQW